MSTSTIDKVRDLVSSGQMTKAALARAAGLHANTLRDCNESGWNPTSDTLSKLDRFLSDGDVVELEIDGLGVLRNRVLPTCMWFHNRLLPTTRLYGRKTSWSKTKSTPSSGRPKRMVPTKCPNS